MPRAQKKALPVLGVPVLEAPGEVVHVQPRPGEVVRVGEHAYGDRSTIQIRRCDLDVLEGGRYDIVDPAKVPDAAER